MKQNHNSADNQWTKVYTSRPGIDFACITDVFKYKFLISELIKKNVRSVYTQTLLGPFWLIAQPVLTSLMFVLVFQKVISLPIQGRSAFVFYSSGVVLWGYFAKSVNSLSYTFLSNYTLFSRLSFPKLVIPVADVAGNFFKFTLQYSLLLVLYLLLVNDHSQLFSPAALFCFLAAILMVSAFAVGIGLTTASLSLSYRDLGIIVGYGINLLFYATPILYSVSRVPSKYRIFFQLNPIAIAIDIFRYPMSGTLNVTGTMVASGFAVALVCCITGLVLFTISQRTCVDKI
ncbi:MAG TPA: ABC transporter permease [Chitinispirillaceae bacterium]|nr:ABC transporter permease [Chitinispirillaceae bacterium]